MTTIGKGTGLSCFTILVGN